MGNTEKEKIDPENAERKNDEIKSVGLEKIGLLPAGSVVLLSDSAKRVMIMGYLQARPEDKEKVYDYCGCLYPEGYMEADKIYLFDHEQIEKIYALGYIDEEQFAFREQLERAYREIRNEN